MGLALSTFRRVLHFLENCDQGCRAPIAGVVLRSQMASEMSTPSSAPPGSERWRSEFLRRAGWILFLGGAPLLFFTAFTVHFSWFEYGMLALTPAAGVLTAVLERRLSFRTRGLLLVAALLISGATVARLNGPFPGMVALPALAATFATVVFGAPGGLVALAIGAVSILVLGPAGGAENAALFAEQLPRFSVWVRMTVTYSIFALILVALIWDAIRRAEKDAAARQTALDDLRQSEERWRRISEASHEGIAFSERGVLLDFNDQFAEIVGYTRDELTGKPIVELVAAEDRGTVAGALRDNLAVAYDHVVLRKDGVLVPVEVRARLLGEGGRPLRVTAIHDLSERQAAEAALRDSEARYRLLFEANPIPMLVYDLESLGFLAVNEAAVKQFGWPREEMLQRSLPDLWTDGDPHLAEFLATRLHPRPVLVHVGHRRQRRRDGTIIDADLISLEIALQGRRARLLLCRDITAELAAAEERSRIEETVRRTERLSAMGTLVAGVAHEVRNPLFSISATVDALEAELGDDEKFSELAGLLRTQVSRLSVLMRDLLEYGSPPVPHLDATEPAEVARRVVRDCAHLARSQGVEILDEVPRGLPVMWVDAGRIQGVLENLLSNALHHSPRGGRVRLLAGSTEGPSVEYRVEDEGPGIDALDLPHVFEPFFSRRRGGTGLGLAIAQRIVEAHGGLVTAANRAEGGARFTVRLPLGASSGLYQVDR